MMNKITKKAFKPIDQEEKDLMESIERNEWKPVKKDFEVIRARILDKIRLKPDYYRYYGEKKNKKFFEELIR